MRSTPVQKNNGIVLWFLIGLAFLLRFLGIHHSGYPLLLHPDEWAIVNPAWNMVVSGDPNPHFFTYGGLNIYLQVMVYLIGFNVCHILGIFQYFTDIDFAVIHLWGRLLIILSSSVTLCVVFKIFRSLFGQSVLAYVTVISLGVSLIHVRNSIAITPNSMTTMFVVLSFYYATKCLIGDSRWHHYILSGFFAGLSVACKYTMVFGVFPILLGFLLNDRVNTKDSRWSPRELSRPIVAILIAVIAFLVANPFAVFDPFTFLGFIEMQHSNYATSGQALHSYVEYARGMVSEFGGLQLLLAGIGAIALGRRDYRKLLLVAAVPVSLFVFVGWYPRGYVRNLLPAAPFLSLLVGFAWEGFGCADDGRRKRVKVAGATILWVVFAAGASAQLARSVRYIHRSSLPRTEARAKRWIEDNLPQGSVIAREGYRIFGPPGLIDRERFTTVDLNVHGLLSVRNYDRFDFLLHYVPNASDDWPELREKYDEKIYSKFDLVKEFDPDQHCAGPVLRIYQVDSRRNAVVVPDSG